MCVIFALLAKKLLKLKYVCDTHIQTDGKLENYKWRRANDETLPREDIILLHCFSSIFFFPCASIEFRNMRYIYTSGNKIYGIEVCDTHIQTDKRKDGKL